jgi:exoribonuclease R
MSASAEQATDRCYISQAELLSRPPETGIAIDQPNPEEIDDAIRVDWDTKDKVYSVAIHIADCGIIDPGSLEVQAARRLGWSKYSQTEDGVPMLPSSLSREQLSLTANHNGLGVPTITVGFDFNPDNGGIFNFNTLPTRLIDCLPTDYSEFDSLISDGDDRAIRIVTVAELLGRYIGIRPKTPPEQVTKHSVEVMMITANHLIAKKALEQGLPWLYRNHGPRPLEPESGPDRGKSDEPQAVTQANLIPYASFSTTPSGHEALGLNPYAGFTSPLRKFADLANHLTLTAARKGRPLPFSTSELDQIAIELTEKQRIRRIGEQTLRVAA